MDVSPGGTALAPRGGEVADRGERVLGVRHSEGPAGDAGVRDLCHGQGRRRRHRGVNGDETEAWARASGCSHGMMGAWWTSLAGPPRVRWAALLWCLVAARVLTRVDGAIISQGEAKFNQQWATGVWDYQDQVPAERLRNAAIGAVLLQKYCPGGDRCAVLEGGCGEGAVTDFLSPAQRLLYTGFDVSEHAVAVAVRKRGHAYGCRFEKAHAHTFPGNASSVDAVVFSEMLYYTDHEAVIDRYVPFLRPHGIMVISLHMPTGKAAHAFDAIFTHAEHRLQLVDVVEVGGRKHPPAPEMTHFRIKVFRLANSTSTSIGGSGRNSSSNATTTV